jgi:murein DD-endopeptidase MepM/ murein hydrolase activator NlpD
MRFYGLLPFALLALLVVACRPAGQMVALTATVPVIAAATLTLPATPVAAPTQLPLPTATPRPPPTLTAVPTTLPAMTGTLPAVAGPATPASALRASPASATPPGATGELAERSCPDPAPPRPVYRHYALAGAAWPTPARLPAAERPRLSPPLISDGLPRLNEQYPYGYDGGGRYLLHNGLDFVEPRGTPLLAVADGAVVVAQPDAAERFGWRCDWYGQLVVLELDERWQEQAIYVLYGHVLNIVVEAGQRVRRGDIVADLGVGGATIGAHLHLEVRLGLNEFGATRNPHLWLEPAPGRGHIAGRLIDSDGRPWQGVQITAVAENGNGPSRVAWSYLVDPLPLVNPDDVLAENFLLPDLPPGSYRLSATIQGAAYTATADVRPGQITPVEILTGE